MCRATEYADGGVEFAVWLKEVDRLVEEKIGLSVFDLEDMMFSDSFDAGESAEDFIREVVVPSVQENYGDEYAALLRE